MTRRFLNAKLHQATVTETNIEYEGSLTIDLELMEKVGIRVFEQVDVYNITRGTRFTTYAIQGEYGRREIIVNGAAAHLAERNDKVIIATYCDLNEDEIAIHKPKILVLGAGNRPVVEK